MGEVEAGVGRWHARLFGVAIGVLVYALFWVLDFIASRDQKQCEVQALGPLAAYCGPGWVFLFLVVWGTPVMAVAVGLFALSRRTRRFAVWLGIGVIVGLLAFFGLLVAVD
jgi:hypothetical protein